MKLKEKLKMEFLIFLGRFYFIFILAFVASVLALVISLMFKDSRFSVGPVRTVIFLGFAMFGILKGFFKALFLKFPKPEGVLINREEHEKLYRIIEEIRKVTDSPNIDFIILTTDFNAAIVERPSLGVLGFYKRYLLIGMPLIISLSEEELKAVIAHECGHLSRSHGKSNLRLHRAHSLWESIAREFDKEKSRGSFFVNWFITRYIPALNSVYFNMSKNNEYEADNISLKVVEKQTFANALAKTDLYSYYMDSKFWPRIGKLNDTEEKPIEDVYFRMEEETYKVSSDELVNRSLEALMDYRSLPHSTHPSYIERVEAIKAESPIIKMEENSAVRTIFGHDADKVLRDMCSYWCSCVQEGWTNYYREIGELKNKLDQLSDKQLTVDEAVERAYIIERLEGFEKALETFEQLKEEYKDELIVDYNIGRLMVYKGLKEGVEILEQVMEKDPQLIPDCCNHIVNYYCMNNEKEKAAEYYHYAVEFMNTHEEVNAEREVIRFSDVFIPHDLSGDTISKVRQELLKYDIINKAYIAIKHVELSGQFPIYIIGIDFKFSSRKERDRVREELINTGLLVWEHWIVDLNGRNKRIQYNMDKIIEARII
jgi:Zn-dependent protease with chaperone function